MRTYTARPRRTARARTNGAAGARPRRAARVRPARRAGTAGPGRRATRPSSSRSSRRALQLGRRPAGARDQRVERRPDRSRARRAADRRAAGAGRRRRRRRRAARRRAAQLLEDVGGAVDQLGALLDQRVAAARLRRMDRAGDREHVAAGLGGQPRGDQRARLQRRLDHQRAARQPGDDAVALIGKFSAQRRRAERELADEQAVARRCAAASARWRVG